MEKKTDLDIEKLIQWLEGVKNLDLPEYKGLPTIPLYMEQVTSYVNDVLTPLTPVGSESGNLTSFMVNNYVKAKIIQEPNGKKYDRDHIGYLMAINTLKNVLSMNELALLVKMDKEVSTDKSILYHFFRLMVQNVGKNVGDKTLTHVVNFYKRYQKDKEAGNKDAEKMLKDSLGLIAFRLGVKASLEERISEAILSTLGEKMVGEDVLREAKNRGKKETKLSIKNSEIEAERAARILEVEEPKKKREKK